MTGRDVAIACMLGAEEFGFATAPLIAIGCVMMRVCNQDTCPVGVTTQNPELRARFAGKPEYVMNFMTFVAEELREIMAKLGVRTINDLVGRTDFLKVREHAITHRAEMVDLQKILGNHNADGKNAVHFEPDDIYDFQLEKTLDEKVLLPAFEQAEAAKGKTKLELDVEVSSTDRTFGTILGSEITKRYNTSLPEDSCVIHAKGGGGQSFGAFVPQGLSIYLEGDSNDYFGKGLSGGKLVVYPPKDCTFKAEENIVIGNVALYGATGGKAFIRGIAGERFCVRNSGAEAVVEGVGDHGCEYMTGGVAVILGKTGKNFAAGMSGGIAYVLDEDHDLYLRLNKELVEVSMVENKTDKNRLRSLIEQHVAATGSELGRRILDDFEGYLPSFKKIIPHEYKLMHTKISDFEGKGLSHEDAEMEAFKSLTAEAV